MKTPTPADLGYRMPAEWQRHTATWLTWPKDAETWPDRVPLVEHIFLQMMAALAPHEVVNLLVDDEAAELAVRARCDFAAAENIHFHRIPTVDSWIRDYGPNFLVSDKLQFVADAAGSEAETTEVAASNDKLKFAGHRLAYNDWIFNAWGDKYQELKRDNAIPPTLETVLKVPCFQPGIVME